MAGVEPRRLLTEIGRRTSNAAIVRTVRALCPKAFILANASRATAVKDLLEAGAAYAFVIPTEAAQGLLAAIYAALNGNLPSFIETHEQRHGRLAERREILG
jgi:hypothetical protein